MNSEKEQILHDIYYSPDTGLINARQLYLKVKDQGFTQKQVTEFIKNQELDQIFKRQEKNFTSIIGGNDDWQWDLMFYEQFKKQNKNYNTISNFVNITSRKAFCYPMKGKDQKEINRVFDQFYKNTDGKINNLTSDNEASFVKAIQRYPQITHWKVQVGDKTKMSIVERFNRTLRMKIEKWMKLHHTKTWYNVLDQLVNNYNNTVHSTIKIAPNKFSQKDGDRIRKEAQIRGSKGDEEIMLFNIGDKVRILKSKKQFAKGSDKFSKQVYEISNIDRRSFVLKNLKSGELISKHYKNWQLQPVTVDVGISNVETKVNESPVEQHSSKKIRKDNKMKRLQNKEFSEGKGFEVQEINDDNEVVYQSRLKPKNEIREKPKIGFEAGDKVKSEFKVDGHIKWYSGEVIKVNPATYKVTFSDGQTLNMKKAEVFADDFKEPETITTPDITIEVPKAESKVKAKVKPEIKSKNSRTLKVGNRVSVLFDGTDWYNGTVTAFDRGMQTVKYDNGDIERHRLLPKSRNKTWKFI
jgi:hypothetical protein